MPEVLLTPEVALLPEAASLEDGLDRIAECLEQPKGLRVLIVGLARSGLSAGKLLARRGAQVTGTDRAEALDGAAALRKEGVRLVLGGDHPELIGQADLVVLSPGVPLESVMPREAARRGVLLLGELELAHRLCPAQVVAITGTNGKSTTSALCAHLLGRAGQKVFLGGNIGNPLSELGLCVEKVDWAVVEVSSFQLEHLSSPEAFVPHAAIWMNLTEDHLDRHGTMEHYGQLKRRLFEGQGQRQFGVFFQDDPQVVRLAAGLCGQRLGFGRDRSQLKDGGVWFRGRELFVLGGPSYTLRSIRLVGGHNAENAAAAVAAVLSCGADPGTIQEGLDTFPGLPHRLEPIAEINGVRYVNDSKGTNVDSTVKSLESFSEPILLIAGGRGKGTGYQKLRKLVKERVRHLILIGEETENIAGDLDGCAEIHRCGAMVEAVQLACQLAQPGDVVLLSPACASFDMFRDYNHRGQVFAEVVRGLASRAG